MHRSLLFVLTMATVCAAANQAAATQDNYVIYNIKGDCNQEDCIAAVNTVLEQAHANILSLDATPLASKQTTDYKTVTITYKTLSNAPNDWVMSSLASLGYNTVSYVIHDLHSGHDVIIPH